MAQTTVRILRGERTGKRDYQEFQLEIEEGWVVLDVVHAIQSKQANDLAVRWNCKAGKCGSCSAEVNGKPRLMCMTRVNELPAGQPITIEPMKRFPLIKDLVTDVSFNYRMNKTIKPFKPMPRTGNAPYRMQQEDVERSQEFHKCIECFLCQNVCHVMRDHGHEDFAGPRFFIRIASLAMHPLDTEKRLQDLKDAHGLGYCNITKCCTEVCPEHIHITDNAIIPMKERVAGAFYDPLAWIWRKVLGKQAEQKHAL
jgi:succinate dehydrogenase / fumarate reductase iron-sulfur subunit